MKILIVSQYYYPEDFRINAVSFELAHRGHDVTVITGLPNYPEGEIYDSYEDYFLHEEHVNGVKILRCNMRPRHRGTINLALNYCSFVLQCNRLIKRYKAQADIVFVYGLSPVTSAIPAIKYKKMHKTPVLFYCLDVWPDSVRDANNGNSLMSKNNPIYLIAKILSKYVYNNVDYISNKCQAFSDYLHRECGIEYRKMNVISDYAESVYLEVNPIPNNNDCFDFMFLGNIGEAQLCDDVVKAFANIESNKKRHLHFVGDGSALPGLKETVNKLGLENMVTFHGRHPVKDIISYYNIADACIISLSASTESGMTPPGKLYSYMASSRMIIGYIDGPVVDIIKRADCGITCNPTDLDALTKKMEYTLDNPDKVCLYGKNARQYFINNFTLNKHVDEIENTIKSIVGV